MKYQILIALLSILLGSCGTIKTEVSGSITFIETQVKQVNGQFYVRTHANGVTVTCLAVDPSTLYPSDWVEIEVANESRLIDYTPTELANCL